ncbi:hypothetical protein ACFVQB_07665 [Paenibacillus sp. NPDC057886]|uniref:hypothetical protein n=1 Tax=Paenibacillus sp. NPDC057886 TaxID=3346270 RepID=UPI0036B49F8E
MDHKKVMTTLLASMLLISSSGEIATAANTNSVSGDSLHGGYTILKRSENMARTYSVSMIASKNETNVENINVDALEVNLENGTEIPQINKQIEIPFTQALDKANQEQYAYDLVIKQLGKTNTPTLIPMIDYTTAVEGNRIIVTFLVDYSDEYAVQVRDSLFIRANGNPASQSEVYTTTRNNPVIAESPKVNLEIGTEIPQINKQIEIPFTQALDTTNQELYAYDLVIKQLGKTNIPTLIPMVDYTSAVEGNKLIVTFLVDYTDEYSVQVRDSFFIRANGIPASQSEVFTTTRNVQLIEE